MTTSPAAELWTPPRYKREQANFKKATPPKTGDAYGVWAGREQLLHQLQLPGGALLQFDLSRLTLSDFRAMRDHYQINISLAVLDFMMHGLDWKIECSDQKIADAVEEDLRGTAWTRMNRALGVAHWAGYAPTVVEWENDMRSGRVVPKRFKDLVPEECAVNWKEVDGYVPPGANTVPPKLKLYDGIKQQGQRFPIPPESTLWYPLLMESGNYYGRKLLRPAFPAWFFSQLIHLFANRYFERFGEPLPIGRAPFDDDIEVDGELVNGRDAMLGIVNNIRNRSVAILPNDRVQVGSSGNTEYEYDIDYLESQMRGADFERYLTRLDEEISLAIFTPVLMTRTADVGSYNLGENHMQVWMWMINALADDRADYINSYVLNRYVDYNFSPNAPRAYWKHRPLGKDKTETLSAIIAALVAGGKVGFDLEEIGTALGLTLKEVRETTEPAPAPEDDPVEDDAAVAKAAEQVKNRMGGWVDKQFAAGQFGPSTIPRLGLRRRFEIALEASGKDSPAAAAAADRLYGRMDRWLSEAVALGADTYGTPERFKTMFDRVLDAELADL